MRALNCVLLPSLDMLLAVGGNGKAQYGIQAQYLIDRCDGPELLVCAGGAGRLTEEILCVATLCGNQGLQSVAHLTQPG
jgi:hypothetical protein